MYKRTISKLASLMIMAVCIALFSGCGGKNSGTPVSTNLSAQDRETIKHQGTPPPNEQIETIKSAIASLPDSAFRNPNNRQALLHKLDAVAKMLGKGNTKGAAKKLKHDILPKMDSCITGNTPPNEIEHDDDDGRNSDRKESNDKDENKDCRDRSETCLYSSDNSLVRVSQLEPRKDKDDDEDIDYSDSDMIIDCSAQAAIYPKVLSLLYVLDGQTIKASQGGTVTAYNTAASVTIPPGALIEDTVITVVPLTMETLPEPFPSDVYFLGAVDFLPEGLEFNASVTITIPISPTLQPGTVVEHFIYDTRLVPPAWVKTGISGVVGEDGQTAIFQVKRFAADAAATSPDGTPPFSTPSVVSTGANILSIAMTNARKIVRDSKGNLHFAYRKGKPGQIYVAKSTDGGTAWSDIGAAPIQAISGYGQFNASIAVDSSDNLHVVWQGRDSLNTSKSQIKYSKYNGTAWSVWTNIQSIHGYNQDSSSIEVDSQDNLHVVWRGLDIGNPSSYQIKYSKFSGNKWSTWTNIQTISGYNQSSPAIVIDSQNNLHVVWSGLDSVDTSAQIKYSKYSAGSWSRFTNIQRLGYFQDNPSIAVDSQDNVHVVWSGLSSDNLTFQQIKYSRYNGSSWSVWTNIQTILKYSPRYLQGYLQGAPSVAIDSQDKVHVIWSGLDSGNVTYSRIKYSSCPIGCENSANWSTWINKTSNTGVSQMSPTFRWSRWNNNGGVLNWGWINGTALLFDKDVTITMPNWPGTKDTTPPITTDDWTDNWTSAQTVTITLTATDVGSGVQATYYCVDTTNNCMPTTMGTTVTVTCAPGSLCTQYVRYYSVDNANNLETVNSKRVRQGLPLVSISISPECWSMSMGETQSFTATCNYLVGSSDCTSQVTWNSDRLTIANFTNPSQPNLLTGLGVGTVNITATFEGVTSNTAVVTIPSIVSTGNDEYANRYNNARKLVRASVGNLYIAYHKNPPFQIYVAKSTDGGNTWSDIGGVPIQTIPGTQWYPSIAIDADDNLHVAWSGLDTQNNYQQIKYSKYSGGSWSVWANIQSIPSSAHQMYPSIAIDSLNTPHVVWAGENGVGQVKYSKYTEGSWSNWINIQPALSGYGQGPPAIAIDSQNNLQVVWAGKDSSNPTNPQIKYSKCGAADCTNSANWEPWTNIQTISGYDQAEASIAIDSQDRPHVVWYGTDSGSVGDVQIKYSKYNGVSWSVWNNIQSYPYHQYNPSLAIDSTDKLHVVWHSRNTITSYNQIKYSYCTSTCEDTTNWTTWTNKTCKSPYPPQHHLFPTFRWSRWNNNGGTLDWSWIDDTTVMFSKDTAVTMSNWPGTKDTTPPTTTDDWTDNWTSAQTVTITLTAIDTHSSGVRATYYCVDTANNCNPDILGTIVTVTCAPGSLCTQYVRYYSVDNANNSETINSKRVRQDLSSAISLVSINIPAPPGLIELPKGTYPVSGVTCTYSDGHPEDCTNTVQWHSTATTVAYIADATLYAVDEGYATITATLDGVTSNEVYIKVVLPPPPPISLVSISISPTNVTLEPGTTQQFTATCTYSDTSTRNCTAEVSWASWEHDTANFITPEQPGLLTTFNEGTANIIASLNGFSSRTAVTVSLPCIIITFPDPNMEAAIRIAPGYTGSRTDPICAKDVDNIFSLDAYSWNISNITGIEHLVSLHSINLNDNSINDISPLLNLANLIELEIARNNITDISLFSNFTQLRKLNLQGNIITDINPIQNLTNMVELYLNHNGITDVVPLQNLTNLSWLDLKYNNITDISPLQNLTNLTWLELTSNSIEDITPLKNLSNLNYLFLDRNNISDIGSLQNLANLRWLWLGVNNINDIMPLVNNLGIDAGDEVSLYLNPLNEISRNVYIPILEARGVTVYYY